MTTTAGMLEGVTVLDLSTVGPGSRCSAMLADLGADVVKVGRPPGKGGIEPHWWAYGAGRNTRRIRIDMTDPRGVEAFLALAATADVILDSFRPGVVDKLGIGYEAVAARNPGIVYAHLTGFGQDGPYARWAGHDIDYLAVGGFLHTQGRRPDGGPAIAGATIADSAGGGMHAVIAITAALFRRERTGEGARLDVAATDGVLSLMQLHIDEYLATGTEPGPDSTLLTGRYACYQAYECADGRWVAVGAIEGKFFRNLCGARGLPERAADQYDDAAQDDLKAALAAAFKAKPRDEWVAELADADTCVAPILTIAEVAGDPHLVARGAFTVARHPEHGEVRQLGPVLAGGERPLNGVYEVSSETHTEELLAAAGLESGRITELMDEGVVA